MESSSSEFNPTSMLLAILAIFCLIMMASGMSGESSGTSYSSGSYAGGSSGIIRAESDRTYKEPYATLVPTVVSREMTIYEMRKNNMAVDINGNYYGTVSDGIIYNNDGVAVGEVNGENTQGNYTLYRLGEQPASGVEEIDNVKTDNSHAESRHYADVGTFWECFSSNSFTAFQVNLNNFDPKKNETGKALQVCVFEPRTEQEKGKVFVRVIREVKGKWYEVTLFQQRVITSFAEAYIKYVESNPEAMSAFTIVGAVQLPTE